MCGCLSHTPYQGFGPQPKHVPWLGIELVTLWFAGWHSICRATPTRAVSHFLYPTLNQRTLKLFSYLDYCELCFNEHWDTYIFMNKCFQIFQVGTQNPKQGFLSHMLTVFLIFWETSLLFAIVAIPVYIPSSSL